jgi:hypothetical protein
MAGHDLSPDGGINAAIIKAASPRILIVAASKAREEWSQGRFLLTKAAASTIAIGSGHDVATGWMDTASMTGRGRTG